MNRIAVRKIWYPRHPWVRRKSSAQVAATIAARILKNEVRPGEIDETTLFSAMHTCGYHVTRRPRVGRVSSVELGKWRRRRDAIRDLIVASNRGLAYAAVARLRPTYQELDDLRSEGLLALVRAVDWFDPWRGVRFSTYAYNAIIRALIRLRKKSAQYRQRFSVTLDFPVETTAQADVGTDLFLDRLHRVMESNLADLTEREADVLGRRFPLGDRPRLTLDEIGATFGLSKERVRQIQNRALAKLRGVLDMDPLLQ